MICRLLLALVLLGFSSALPFAAAQQPQTTTPASPSADDLSLLNLGRATVVTAATLGLQERTAVKVLRGSAVADMNQIAEVWLMRIVR